MTARGTAARLATRARELIKASLAGESLTDARASRVHSRTVQEIATRNVDEFVADERMSYTEGMCDILQYMYSFDVT